ncbi:MAG: hypothetical protein U0T33_10095 [Bacteroidales bacterium]
MKRINLAAVLILLVLASCQKNTEVPYELKFYGDTREDIGYSVAIATDGYIIAGQMEVMSRQNGYIDESKSNKELCVLKTDWGGNLIWQAVAGDAGADMGSKVYQLSDGSMICVGTYTDTVSNTSRDWKKQIFIVKITKDGSVLWKKTYGGADNQTGKDIVESTGGFLVLGTTDAFSGPVTDSTGNPKGKTDLYILKLNSNGDSLDSYQRGYPVNETPAGIKKDIDGRFIVIGTTEMSLKNSGMAGNNIFAIKLNSAGDVIDSRIIGTTEEEYASAFEVMTDGYLVAGTVGSAVASQQGYVVKLKRDIHADPFFSQKFKISEYPTSIKSLCKYQGSTYVAAGYVYVNPGLRMVVTEIDESGNPVSGASLIHGSVGDQVVNDVAAGDDGYVIAVGRNTYEVNSMISFLKFKF